MLYCLLTDSIIELSGMYAVHVMSEVPAPLIETTRVFDRSYIIRNAGQQFIKPWCSNRALFQENFFFPFILEWGRRSAVRGTYFADGYGWFSTDFALYPDAISDAFAEKDNE